MLVQAIAPFNARSNAMEIKRIGSQPSAKGPADWFTGTVRIDSMFDRTEPARVGGGVVTFEPGARTAWHTHPLGQTLIAGITTFSPMQHWKLAKAQRVGVIGLGGLGHMALKLAV